MPKFPLSSSPQMASGARREPSSLAGTKGQLLRAQSLEGEGGGRRSGPAWSWSWMLPTGVGQEMTAVDPFQP